MNDSAKNLIKINSGTPGKRQPTELSKTGNIFEIINHLSELEIDKSIELSNLAIEDLKGMLTLVEDSTVSIKTEGTIKTGSGTFKIKIKKGVLW
jgi:hypothetical protein